jgi:type IV pilus assembly protein PilB
MRYSSLTSESIKKILLDSGVIEEARLEEAARRSEEEKTDLADIVVSQGLISDEELSKLVADELGFSFVSLSKAFPGPEILSFVPEVVARKKRLVPFQKDGDGIHLAMADPTDLEIVNFIERKEGVPVIAHVASGQDVDKVLDLYGKGLADLLENFPGKNGDAGKPFSGKSEDDFSIIRSLKKIVIQAYRNRASDIHIEPRENRNSVIRFRIDGVLHDILEIPRETHPQIISRIKVMAKLRTDEHQIPQDGKIEFPLEEQDMDMDVRVSIVPVTEGEKAVLRLLAERSRQFSLANVGFSDADLKKVEEAYKKPYGMILSTGPTGCGKTTTLYAILKLLNRRQVNIMTIEDPVEYDIEGVNQIQVNPKAKLTFATGLRSILRQDPNIILVGEIRDQETAGIAVNFALTGHLVLSTLHTNDAATAIPRLIDLGIEPFLVSTTVNTIIAQRLVRKIHDACRASEEIRAEDIAKKIGWDLAEKVFSAKKSDPAAAIRLYRGKGCDACQQTGYQGRLGIFEVMTIDDEIREAISRNQDAGYLREISRKAGMRDMLEDGLEKVKIGITTVDEVLGVTKA